MGKGAQQQFPGSSVRAAPTFGGKGGQVQFPGAPNAAYQRPGLSPQAPVPRLAGQAAAGINAFGAAPQPSPSPFEATSGPGGGAIDPTNPIIDRQPLPGYRPLPRS